MASTARSKDEKKEYFDSPEELDRKVSLLAQWVRGSRHMIAFTGAGISTAAGIPDFRSGMDTTLETGPGVWELRAGKVTRDPKYKTTDTTKAIPTATHMTFVKLHQEGVLKCVISQNVDGLHRRSGLPKNALYELHGNTNVERCVKCKREYLRDYRVRKRGKHHRHFTGNTCDDPKCNGKLKDTIINFGEDLPDDALQASFDHAGKSDLCVAMGSSLTVTPAADIPETVGERGSRLVIVNLQETPLDSVAKVRINAKCDDVSRLLMAKLGLEIPEFTLKRKIKVSAECQTVQGLTKITVQGADTQGLPFSFLKEVVFTNEGRSHCVKEEPYVYPLRWAVKSKATVTLAMSFHSHYGEPPLQQVLELTRGKNIQVILDVEYTPGSSEWTVGRPAGGPPKTRPDAAVEELCTKIQAAKLQ